MATQVTPALIKELRERTGIGMTDCKKALDEAQGNMDDAINILRKKGLASAVKKEGRATNEGVIHHAEHPERISLVEVNAETDFVVQNERFREFAKDIAEEAASTNPATLEAFLEQKFSKDKNVKVDEYRATIVQTIGENIQIRRLMTLPKSPEKSIGIYSHLGGKIVAIVEVDGSADVVNLAKDIAMQVAAADPEYLSETTIPEDVIEREREIAKTQVKGKPEHIIDKIVDGKMKAYYDSCCLLRQKYIKDDSMTITQLLEAKSKEIGKPLSVSSFTRWAVGQ